MYASGITAAIWYLIAPLWEGGGGGGTIAMDRKTTDMQFDAKKQLTASNTMATK